MIQALLECDSMGQVHLSELLAYRAGARLHPPDLSIKDNILTATAVADSMSIYLTYKNRLERHLTTSTKTENQIVEVNRLTRWQRGWMRIGQGLAILIVIGGALKLRKLITVL